MIENLSKTIENIYLIQGSGTRDDLDKFSGNDGLAGSVEG